MFKIVELPEIQVEADLKRRDRSTYLGIPNVRAVQET